MPHPLRLRQICLAAPRLAPVINDLQTILGIGVCYRDPNVAAYGLENALLPIGSDFLEVVAPIQADTAAGRFITRTRGHGGYMAIFQADDPRRRQAHAAELGVRTAHVIDREAYQNTQLHPRDCRAAFIEFGHSVGGDDRMGTWWPAGPQWQQAVRTEHTLRLLGIDLESPDPLDLASHWSRLIETPLSDAAGAPALAFEGSTIRFVVGETECLGRIRLAVRDTEATLDRAVGCGLHVSGRQFHLGGVHFELSAG